MTCRWQISLTRSPAAQAVISTARCLTFRAAVNSRTGPSWLRISGNVDGALAPGTQKWGSGRPSVMRQGKRIPCRAQLQLFQDSPRRWCKRSRQSWTSCAEILSGLRS